MYKDKKIVSPLPAMFICSVLFIAVLNMKLFFTSYDSAIEDNPNNKQLALSSIESSYTDSFAGKNNYLDLNGLFSRLVDKKELNRRYKLNNGYLTDTIVNYNNSLSGINNITNLKKYLDLYDIPFAYVQTPHLIPADDDPMIPFGYETHINGNSDRLLEGLENNGVTYLDLRENFKEDEINHYEVFYPTDNHWTTEAGLISHKYVAQFIDELLGEKISIDDYFVESRYDVEVFKNEFLGSHAKRTGIFFAGLDDVSVITPNFFTKFHVESPSLKIDKIGDFKETQIDYSILENNLISPFTKNEYRVYPLQNSDYAKITNLNANNDKVILLLRDSFTAPIAPFLALHYKEVHLYDVRYGDKQEGFINVLHEVNPDIVLQVRITSDVLTNEAKAEI